ncbi:hypothetical protein NDU88_007877 [Pleurodeles waltl]|uniref:Uncharacterized protein n=1 Tax=Pleurodeles waltl TaxID=8319 RepID=A0AAV7VTK6_PLEWA|nr:hypothetical protein NDU88_007877 [Pleurodeles waltl]
MPLRSRIQERLPTQVSSRVGTPESMKETTTRESGSQWGRAALEALEIQVEQLNEPVAKSSREIDELKAKNKQGAERLESLESNTRRNNIKLMNVTEGREGEYIKAFVVDLLKQSGRGKGRRKF